MTEISLKNIDLEEIAQWKKLITDIDEKVGIRWPHLILISFNNDNFLQKFVDATTNICNNCFIQTTILYLPENTTQIALTEQIAELQEKNYADAVFLLTPTLEATNSTDYPPIMACNFHTEEEFEITSFMPLLQETMQCWWNTVGGYLQ